MLEQAPPPQEQNFQGVNATMVMVNGNVPVSGTSGTSTSASLSARLYVFNEPGKINYGAKVITAFCLVTHHQDEHELTSS